MQEAALLIRRPELHTPGEQVFWLSEDGSQEEIARNLFSLLRQLDTGKWRRIHAEVPAGSEGLTPAIRDRLTRAAARR
jgi:L-threonylcarbamoyladenylate synthase